MAFFSFFGFWLLLRCILIALQKSWFPWIWQSSFQNFAFLVECNSSHFRCWLVESPMPNYLLLVLQILVVCFYFGEWVSFLVVFLFSVLSVSCKLSKPVLVFERWTFMKLWVIVFLELNFAHFDDMLVSMLFVESLGMDWLETSFPLNGRFLTESVLW